MDQFNKERVKIFVNTLSDYQKRHSVNLENMSLRELVSEMKNDEISKVKFTSISTPVDENMKIDAIVLLNDVAQVLGQTSPEYLVNGGDVLDTKLKILRHINSDTEV